MVKSIENQWRSIKINENQWESNENQWEINCCLLLVLLVGCRLLVAGYILDSYILIVLYCRRRRLPHQRNPATNNKQKIPASQWGGGNLQLLGTSWPGSKLYSITIFFFWKSEKVVFEEKETCSSQESNGRGRNCKPELMKMAIIKL